MVFFLNSGSFRIQKRFFCHYSPVSVHIRVSYSSSHDVALINCREIKLGGKQIAFRALNLILTFLHYE